MPQVICREGYKDGAALLQHTKEVPSELATIITNIGPDRVKILCSGPAGELAKVRPHMEGGLPIQFVTLDTGAMVLNNFPTGCEDKHVTILPQFEVPQEKLEEFKKGFQKFYQATKASLNTCNLRNMFLIFSGWFRSCRLPVLWLWYLWFYSVLQRGLQGCRSSSSSWR